MAASWLAKYGYSDNKPTPTPTTGSPTTQASWLSKYPTITPGTTQPKPASMVKGSYAEIGGKQFPRESIITDPASPYYKKPSKSDEILDSAKSVFQKLQDAAASAGRSLQKVDTTIKNRPGLAKALPTPIATAAQVTNKEKEVVEFLSGLPGAMANSYGKTLERLATKEGRNEVKTGAQNLPKTIAEVKGHIANKEFGKAFETALSNPALAVALDVSDFIPVAGIATAGPKAGLKAITRQTAKEFVEKAVEATEKKAIKSVVNASDSPVVSATKEVIGNIPSKEVKSIVEIAPAKPIGEGQTRVSTLGLKVEQTAIEKKLTTELGELPEYKQLNMKDQASKAGNLLNTDPDKAMRIALGEELPPEGLLKESVFKALEGSISTPEMARKLATSPIVSEGTSLGQRIKALDVQISDSPVEAMRQVIDARQKAIESRLGKNANKATDKIVKDIQSKIKAPDKYDWNSFVESIKC